MTVDAPHNEDPNSDGVSPEDCARAEVYALLSSLFYEAPTAAFLKAVATSEMLCNDDSDSGFCRAWRSLQQAAAAADPDAVQDEFTTAFIGTGRQPVMLYASYYLAGFLNEKPLAQLRDVLTKMGFARRRDRHETEDHISALCDVMRFLIVGNHDTPPAALEVQREFFLRQIKSWNNQLCAAVGAASATRFYKDVGRFAGEFFAVENAAFEIV